jgi:hypothetical protein
MEAEKVSRHLWICAALVGALAGAAMADEFKLTPSIAVRQEYNDNIFFDSSQEKDSFVTRVIPGLELIERTERLDLRLTGAVTPYFYWDESDLNSVDQEYSGKAVYALTSRLNAGAEAAVRVDHQPDRDIRTTGVAYTDNRRIQQRYGGNLGYQFTELTSADLAYRYSREDWRSSEDEDLENYDSHAVTLGLSRDLGSAKGVTVGLANAGYAHYAYDTSQTDYWFGTVGVRHRLTEVFNVMVDGGARYSRSEFDIQRRKRKTLPAGARSATPAWSTPGSGRGRASTPRTTWFR